MLDVILLSIGAVTSFILSYYLFSNKTKRMVQNRKDLPESVKTSKIRGAIIAGIICVLSGFLFIFLIVYLTFI